METAALLSWAIDRMTLAGPVTTSAPAKTPLILVSRVSSSVLIFPDGVLSSSEKIVRSALWPIATMTVSAGRVGELPSQKVGLNLPSPSKTEAQQRVTRPETLPPLVKILFTPRQAWITTPSSSASLIS